MRPERAEGDASSKCRPRSLVGDHGHPGENKPERRPIEFDVTLYGAPLEVVRLVDDIKAVASKFLYHWHTFPIVLPPPIESERFNPQDLFVAPSFDELDAVAVDSKGEPRRLTNKHLETVREKGEFEVPSLNFPGQVHKWRLSLMLQQGCERTYQRLLDDLAYSLTLIIVTCKARITSDKFSLKASLRALWSGIVRLFGVVFGVPAVTAHDLDEKIRQERHRYLVAELVCYPEYKGSLNTLCNFLRRQIKRASTEKFAVEQECSQTPCPIPYLYQTPQGVHMDLRLFKRNLMLKCIPILSNILAKESRGWFLHFRERLIAELRAQKMPEKDIEKEVKEAVLKEYLQRVFNSILLNPGLASLGSGIPDLLIKQCQATVLMHRSANNVRRKLERTKANLRERLENTHPILSRIKQWMGEKLRAAEDVFFEQNKWNAHQEAASMCSAQGLTQAAYFLQRDLTFRKEREPVLLKELRKVKKPNRSFRWLTQIWFPVNWIIHRNFQGQSEVIPTVLTNQTTSIVTPRSDPSQPIFLVEKETVRVTTTRWPMWRCINYCHRVWSWTWNAMYFFGIVIPWYSSISLRALFSIEPFMTDLELSQVNGTLFPRKSSITPTAMSRLIALWRHISKSRTNFETKPDTGFIGKGLTRHMNRVWNYLIKGTFGTLFILLIFPMTCIGAAILSFLVALTAFIWVPVITLLLHVFMMLIYDLDTPEIEIQNRLFILVEVLVLNILIQGFLQPLGAIIVAFVFCPISSLFLFIVSVLRYWLRLSWDSIMFQTVIKKKGRIPSSDSAFVKRISGPGLTRDYYFQIRPEQALAALESVMELEELSAFQKTLEVAIVQPQKDFAQFVEACFGPFSVQLAKVGPYKQLEKEGCDLIASLHEKLEHRRQELNLGLSENISTKIKLNVIDLKVVMKQASLMLSRFYPTHVIARLNCTEEEYWESRGLSVNDWSGLAVLLFTNLFGPDFITPLGEADTRFRLDPHSQVDLTRFSDLVQTTEIVEGGPDLLGTVYSPRGNIAVQPPNVDVTVFNPRPQQFFASRDKKCDVDPTVTWMKGSTPKVWATRWTICGRQSVVVQQKVHNYHPPIPLPIPHPVMVALIVFNRDTDNPVPLDSEVCSDILRIIENALVDCESTPESIDHFRSRGAIADSSIDSLDTSSDGELDRATNVSETPTQQKIDITETTEENQRETLPCSNAGFHWTLTNWGQNVSGRRRNPSGTVRVDLASPEDVTLDTDSSRVIFATYGTSV